MDPTTIADECMPPKLDHSAPERVPTPDASGLIPIAGEPGRSHSLPYLEHSTDIPKEALQIQNDSQYESAHHSAPKRPLWFWIVIAALVCIFSSVGLGVGLRYGLRKPATGSASSPVSSSTLSSTKPNPSITTQGSTTSSDTTSAMSSATTPALPPTTASATTSAVTSGTTGIADFTCDGDDSYAYVTNNNPTGFTEECYVDYPAGMAAKDSNSPIVDLAIKRVYTFQDCMEKCAMYNGQRGDPPCKALSYTAVLRKDVDDKGGYCYLKNARGEPYDGDSNANYTLMGSAYVASEYS